MSGQAQSPAMVPPDARARAARWWPAVDRGLERIGDRLNPILVKETRQALKSRQFGVTFGLVLLCAWVWSIFGAGLMWEDIWHGGRGADMFLGYYVILAFPLLVIVPFGAFRSLAGEQEDRTYELMSITTLGPRQIVRGKLGSAVLQMLIYLSAVSPCLAFTYLLRGIDLPTILFFLVCTVLGSLALAVVGLLLATLTSEKHWQVVLSVFLVAGLLLAFMGSFRLVEENLHAFHGLFTEAEFWQVIAAFLTGYVSYLVLLFYAAAAQITFPSDNRSTRLRLTMMAQHVLFTGWMAWVWLSPGRGDESVLILYMIFIGLHWYVMGMFMTGEPPELSPRVKRHLPQSFLGRVFLTWFNPGPAAGYVLAISSLVGALAVVAAALGVAGILDLLGPTGQSFGIEQILTFGILGVSYVVIYLGVGLLLVRALRRFVYVGVPLSAMLQLLLVLVGMFVPWLVQSTWPGSRGSDYLDYTWVRTADPVCSLVHVVARPALPTEAPLLLTVVPGLAVVVFLLNLPAVVREVQQVRAPKPQRVAEEDAELAARKAPPQLVRTSPWD